jgi:pimeloyl-ACP methyl ester carboxylesterase
MYEVPSRFRGEVGGGKEMQDQAGGQPTLVVHDDDDQIVPIAASASLSAEIVKNATLKVYKGAPHGLTDTHKEQLNEELLAFPKAT